MTFSSTVTYSKNRRTLLADAAHRLRAVLLESLPDLNEPSLLQRLQLPTQIPVGKGAKRLQVAKEQAIGVSHQRGEDAEPRRSCSSRSSPP